MRPFLDTIRHRCRLRLLSRSQSQRTTAVAFEMLGRNWRLRSKGVFPASQALPTNVHANFDFTSICLSGLKIFDTRVPLFIRQQANARLRYASIPGQVRHCCCLLLLSRSRAQRTTASVSAAFSYCNAQKKRQPRLVCLRCLVGLTYSLRCLVGLTFWHCCSPAAQDEHGRGPRFSPRSAYDAALSVSFASEDL
jgi:hypothetical protein